MTLETICVLCDCHFTVKEIHVAQMNVKKLAIITRFI